MSRIMAHRMVFRMLAVRLTVVLRTDRVARLGIRIRCATSGVTLPTIRRHTIPTLTDPEWEELLGQTRNPVNTINTRY